MVSFAEPDKLEEPVPYRVVFARRPSAGPLAGLEAGLAGARNEVIFAVACDMPYVTQEVAQMAVSAARRCDAAIPRIEGRAEPVSGAYRPTALPFITGPVHTGRFHAPALPPEHDVTWL